MGPWKPWYSGALVIAFLVSLSVVYYIGKSQGGMDEILAENHAKIVASDSVTKSVTSKVDSAKKSSDILTTYRAKVRAKVEVRGDSVLATNGNSVGKDSVLAVSPEIAQLIQADDSAIAALKNTVALQDSLIGALHKGITLRDERISLLEGRRSPRFGIKSGIAIGAVSTVAIVVVAVKVIQALHR